MTKVNLQLNSVGIWLKFKPNCRWSQYIIPNWCSKGTSGNRPYERNFSFPLILYFIRQYFVPFGFIKHKAHVRQKSYTASLLTWQPELFWMLVCRSRLSAGQIWGTYCLNLNITPIITQHITSIGLFLQ